MLLGFIAMVNPVKIGKKKNQSRTAGICPYHAHKPAHHHEQPVTIAFPSPCGEKVLKAGKAKSHTNDGEAADDESNELELQPVSSNVEDLEANGIAVTLNLEQRNFSMPEGRLVTPPPPRTKALFHLMCQ